MTQVSDSCIGGWVENRAARVAEQVSCLLLCLLLALLPSRLHAQAIFGSINGTVTDASGAVVPNASITVTDTDKGTTRVVTSSDSGVYLVHDLIPDHYQLKVEAARVCPACNRR